MACINYTLALAIRHFGYPMNGEPSKESYAPFIAELIGTEMLKRIRRAWGKVIYKHNESGLKSCSPDELYKEWVKNRVAEIKLPFPIARNKGRKSNIQEESYEDKEFMMKLANLKAKKSALEESMDIITEGLGAGNKILVSGNQTFLDLCPYILYQSSLFYLHFLMNES
jgi:hypothetical protein